MAGDIRKFGRKGYEAIPRETLQDRNLSYGATGLLCELVSYNENWILYKKELYQRRDLNKRSSVDRFWNELIESGYIVQYKRRNGKSYDYQYIFSSTRFTIKDLDEIHDEMTHANFEIHISNMVVGKFIENIITEKSFAIEKWTLSKLSKELIFEMLKNNIPKNVDLSGFLGMLNLNSSKTASNRTITKENLKEEDEDIYNINPNFENNQKSEKSKKDMFSDIVDEIKNEAEEPKQNNVEPIKPVYTHAEMYFIEHLFIDSKIPKRIAVDVCSQIDRDFNNLFVIECIIQQLDFMIGKIQSGDSVFNFPTYFMNGLRDRVELSVVSMDRDLASRIELAYGKTKSISKPVPMYDWLAEFKN